MSIDFQDPSAKSQGRRTVADQVGIPISKLKPFFQRVEPRTFQQSYNNFVDAYPNVVKKISNLKPEGVGPGEVLAWFVFDDIVLGGKNSPIDLYVGNEPFAEMKAGRYRKIDHSITDFKITKDTDRAVALLRRDLSDFNETYYQITGAPLPKWDPGTVNVTTLREWSKIDLKKLAKKYAGPPTNFATVWLNANGGAYLPSSKTPFAYWNQPGFQKKVEQFMLSDVEIPVDNKTSTLKKIAGRWKEQAFNDYLKGKRLALVNTKCLRMMYFDVPTREMIGLFRVGRNQPQAQIYLPDAGNNEK